MTILLIDFWKRSNDNEYLFTSKQVIASFIEFQASAQHISNIVLYNRNIIRI